LGGLHSTWQPSRVTPRWWSSSSLLAPIQMPRMPTLPVISPPERAATSTRYCVPDTSSSAPISGRRSPPSASPLFTMLFSPAMTFVPSVCSFGRKSTTHTLIIQESVRGLLNGGANPAKNDPKGEGPLSYATEDQRRYLDPLFEGVPASSPPPPRCPFSRDSLYPHW